MVIGLAQQTGNSIPAGEGLLTSIVWNVQELNQLSGTIEISELSTSGYFGSEISNEVGSGIILSPDLNIHASGLIPKDTKLHSAYPNPFNPIVKIPFDITKKNIVELSVFNINGKKIKELVSSKSMNPGKYVMEWDASLFPSGMYFYTIRAGSFFQTKKMILLK